MNEEQTHVSLPTEVKSANQKWYTPLTHCTPLSKYFAMAIFVVLPFVGFWLGLQYVTAPTGSTSVGNHTSSPSLPVTRVMPTAVSSELQSESASSSEVTCVSMQTGEAKNYCLAYEAIDKANVTMCNQITQSDVRHYCEINVHMKNLYADRCRSAGGLLYDHAICSKPYERSDPKRTVWSQMEIETPSNAISPLILYVDYAVKSKPGAKGVVSIFMDDQIVYYTGVESGDPTLKAQQIPLRAEQDGTVRPGKHTLTFRVDPFSIVKSDVEFSNIRLATVK
jgi:hypothetical protein